ncbi:TPA: TetR family transcriptional regulator [Stenotrophomonas maltophilia]|uniref:TetR/AcrR family transcriptional regulator n=1 Tax=Stenotrophomonas forensis TaxID=2871169 RepID=A0ABY7Y1L1_9GAMM|nr:MULTISPECIES: TetR/AcrR family transcriptional regulator [Stenotrophomonas]ALA80759.1 TetR family transcriptional regulator [Stenotrophomonas maltophilia]MBA0434196.1 TetR/AcrR family transcriptional regulator [Stenotrophomonas maltophilia]MBH1478185.1 TetR family transcriptional regulator [Stenotrophomonas maltophilia]MBH1503912.1 TetR family transcriptional regulator [Stenotrophomonas maltophilia]MBH1787961.1 TetR family transcriptional regulator [Stenotrophomonas maltophilia]
MSTPVAPTTRKPRQRDAEATREAILASARRAFALSGYDGAGVRDIAAGAGVTAMMVNRYFGSKEQLFAEVVEDTMTQGSLIAGGIMDQPEPGKALARALVKMTRADATPMDGFLITFHSASSPLAAEIGRDKIAAHHLETVAASLQGTQRAERAALILAMISGFQVMRQMIALPALADADEDELAELLGTVFERLIQRPAAGP